MFSIMTMASSTTKPAAMVERHERQVVERIAEQVHRRERTHDRKRHRQAGDEGRREIAQEKEDHQDHQHHGEFELELHVGHGGADRVGAVGQNVHFDGAGQGRLDLRQECLDGIGHAMTLAPG